MKCSFTFTNCVLIFNAIVLCIRNTPKYIKIASINLLSYIIICGNILVLMQRERIQKDCKATSSQMKIGNIVFHICIPILFIFVWIFYKKTTNNFNPIVNALLAAIVSISTGILYLLFMNLDIAYDYGLQQNIMNMYIGVGILLTMLNCPLLSIQFR